MAALEEEEEEEDELWFRRPVAAPAASKASGDCQPRIDIDGEEVIEEVAEAKRNVGNLEPSFGEQLLEEFDFLPSISDSGLRQRHGFGSRIASEPRILGPDEDFALGSERLPDPPRAQGKGVQPAWRILLLGMLGLGILLAIASITAPRETSFKNMRDSRYAREEAKTKPAEDAGRLASWFAVLLSRDRSFDGHVAWSRYVNHGPFALGSVALSVASSATSDGKLGKPSKAAKSSGSQAASRKVYEHRYLGLLGLWLPLPYLPQPGQKTNTFGVGLCLLSRCVCIPDLRSKGSKSGAKSGKGCWRFHGGKSAALNVMAIPNGLLFFLWQWPSYWSALAAHTTLSLANLSRGRLWVMLTAPFSHRSWGEIFTSALLLTNTLDSFDRAGVSFSVFLILYLGGCWVAWLARQVLWNRLFRGDKNAFYTQECGAAGGLAAQLMFMARARPEERFSFSMYFIPLPVKLSAWQSMLAHGLLAVFSGNQQPQAQVLASVSAWVFGFFVYDAFKLHL